jgi:SEC-C motif
MKTTCAFEITSKRRKGFPSETGVKRGDRIVRGSKELAEKLGRNDPCPCGSARSFQALLSAQRMFLTVQTVITIGADSHAPINTESCPRGKGLAR